MSLPRTIKWIGSPHYYKKNVFPKKHITLHWMVGFLAGTDVVFQRDGYGSSQYGIEDDVIHQYVKEKDYAWADANTYSNTNGISIEHAGGYVRSGKRVKPSPATHETSAQLCADIAKRHKLGRLAVGKNVYRHSDWSNTQCPGTLDVEWIAARANEIAKLPIVVRLGSKINVKQALQLQGWLARSYDSKAYWSDIQQWGIWDGTYDGIHDGIPGPLTFASELKTWGKHLKPKPVPVPVQVAYTRLPESKQLVAPTGTVLQNIMTGEKVKTYGAGFRIEAVGLGVFENKVYYMTGYSFGDAEESGTPFAPNGFLDLTMETWVESEPDEPDLVPDPEDPEPEPELPPTGEPVPGWFVRFITALIDAFTKFLAGSK